MKSPRYGTRHHQHTVTGEDRQGETVARVAFEWRSWPAAPTVVGYCNLDVIPEGAHIDGFRQGLAEAGGRRDFRRVFAALSVGLHAVVSMLVIDPQYQGPTRDRIGSKEARAAVKQATATALARALEVDPALRDRVAHLLKRTRSR